MELQICTFFNPDLLWREQLTTLIGQEEVEKLDRKLKSLSVDGLDDLRIEYSDMFCSRPVQQLEPLLDIVRDIGSWPQVTCPHSLQSSYNPGVGRTRTSTSCSVSSFCSAQIPSPPAPLGLATLTTLRTSLLLSFINISTRSKQDNSRQLTIINFNAKYHHLIPDIRRRVGCLFPGLLGESTLSTRPETSTILFSMIFVRKKNPCYK